MSLNKEELKNNIKALIEGLMTQEEASIDEFAEGLADHIDTYVKGADIKYTNGLFAGSTAVTGNFNGELE